MGSIPTGAHGFFSQFEFQCVLLTRVSSCECKLQSFFILIVTVCGAPCVTYSASQILNISRLRQAVNTSESILISSAPMHSLPAIYYFWAVEWHPYRPYDRFISIVRWTDNWHFLRCFDPLCLCHLRYSGAHQVLLPPFDQLMFTR